MDNITKKNLGQPDETKTPEKLKSEMVTVNGLIIHRLTAEPGWQWSKHLKPIAGGDSCQMHHQIYILSGSMHAKMDNGNEVEFGPGDFGDIPPGHDGWNSGPEPVVWLELSQKVKI
jgi:mannose-6-phosphate isomerase-like protein (cupin superfamily)